MTSIFDKSVTQVINLDDKRIPVASEGGKPEAITGQDFSDYVVSNIDTIPKQPIWQKRRVDADFHLGTVATEIGLQLDGDGYSGATDDESVGFLFVHTGTGGKNVHRVNTAGVYTIGAVIEIEEVYHDSNSTGFTAIELFASIGGTESGAKKLWVNNSTDQTLTPGTASEKFTVDFISEPFEIPHFKDFELKIRYTHRAGESLNLNAENSYVWVERLAPSSVINRSADGVLDFAKIGNTDLVPVGKLPVATQRIEGIVELASSGEVTAGTNNSHAVTPMLLQKRFIIEAESRASADLVLGNKIRSEGAEREEGDAEINTRIDGIDEGFIVGRLVELFALKEESSNVPLHKLSRATYAAKGVMEIATLAEAAVGTDRYRAITPLVLKGIIDNLPQGGTGTTVDVIDNLTSESTTAALSANQGNVLKVTDDALGLRITETNDARVLSHTQLQTNINNEKVARANADSALGVRIDGISTSGGAVPVIDNLDSTSATSALSANQGRVLDEERESLNASRISGNSVLQQNIDAEAVLRTTEDTALQTNLDAETEARENGDAALSARIDGNTTVIVDDLESESATSALSANQGRALAAARVSGDDTLLTRIIGVEALRESADTALGARIDAIDTTATPTPQDAHPSRLTLPEDVDIFARTIHVEDEVDGITLMTAQLLRVTGGDNFVGFLDQRGKGNGGDRPTVVPSVPGGSLSPDNSRVFMITKERIEVDFEPLKLQGGIVIDGVSHNLSREGTSQSFAYDNQIVESYSIDGDFIFEQGQDYDVKIIKADGDPLTWGQITKIIASNNFEVNYESLRNKPVEFSIIRPLTFQRFNRFPHNQTSRPKHVWVNLVNRLPDEGYIRDDMILLTPNFTEDSGYSLHWNQENIIIKFSGDYFLPVAGSGTGLFDLFDHLGPNEDFWELNVRGEL